MNHIRNIDFQINNNLISMYHIHHYNLFNKDIIIFNELFIFKLVQITIDIHLHVKLNSKMNHIWYIILSINI